jgi:hypothetical protein
MSTFFDSQLAQLHALIADNGRSEQAIVKAFDDVRLAIGNHSCERARDSIAQAYAISLCYVLSPSNAANIADEWVQSENDGR